MELNFLVIYTKIHTPSSDSLRNNFILIQLYYINYIQFKGKPCKYI